MPRQARLDVLGALHHIMVRGIIKSAIFNDDQDRQKFVERLEKNVVRYYRGIVTEMDICGLDHGRRPLRITRETLWLN